MKLPKSQKDDIFVVFDYSLKAKFTLPLFSRLTLYQASKMFRSNIGIEVQLQRI
jgi:hypothetical protein